MSILALTIGILAIVNLPYLLATWAPPPPVFSGILFNPLDGNSYLSKMREGWRGEWLFTLAYTAQPGPGVFIFTYHLFLGHLARWTGASVELLYHLTRLVTSIFFLLTAYHFVARFFDSSRARLGVWLLFVLGSGLGWLTVAFGGFTADFWVAEAFPFLTIFSNAHIPLTWALVLWIFELTLLALPRKPSRMLAMAALVTLQAQVQPMALITVGLIVGATTLGRSLTARRILVSEWITAFIVGGAALPWLIYAALVPRVSPALAEWSQQNITLSPPLWETLLVGGVPLLLAVLGLWAAARRRSPLDLVLLYWLVLGALSLYAPFALQRRLSLGLWMPLVLLAGVGVRDVIWVHLAPRWRPGLVALIALFAFPTNLVVYAGALAATQTRPPELFFTRDEAAAFDWLAIEAPGALVVAAPSTGLFIPAHSDARVIYGHPLETADASAQRQAVEGFFAGRTSPEAFFTRYPADYVFYGPREKSLGPLPNLPGWQVVFQQGGVTIYGRS